MGTRTIGRIRLVHSEIADAWKWNSLPASIHTIGTYHHDCGVGLPACAAGEEPGISYSKGTWDWPDPNSPGLPTSSYDPANPPLFHPGADTTGSRKYTDSPPATFVAAPYGTAGTYDGWAWTLNYGYAAPPGNDIVYGPDPGPPLPVMNELTLGGDSIPGQTGTPISFPAGWTTRGGCGVGGCVILAEETDPRPTDPIYVTLYNDPTLHPNLNQPSWAVNLYRDVVGNTKNIVNWGLMTFTTMSGTCGASTSGTRLSTSVRTRTRRAPAPSTPAPGTSRPSKATCA